MLAKVSNKCGADPDVLTSAIYEQISFCILLSVW